jgi:hypothetical protein
VAKYNIKIDQGATFKLLFFWREPLIDAAGDLVRDADENVIPASPNDLTGFEARMQIRKSHKDTVAMLTLTSDPAAGITVYAPVVTMHPYVIAASTVNLDLNGLETVDTVPLAVGDRVLVKDQADPSENGIYYVASGAWTRAGDADTAAELTVGACVWVYKGSQNNDTVWRQSLAVASFADPQTWVKTAEVGRVEVIVTDEQTEDLTSSGVYDLELVSPAGEVYRPLEGKMRLSKEVTRVSG